MVREDRAPFLRQRLRLSATLTVVFAAALAPLERWWLGVPLPALWLLLTACVALASGAGLLSTWRLSPRQVEHSTVAIGLAQVMLCLASYALTPSVPALHAALLASLLSGSVLIFVWSPWQGALVCTVGSLGFLAVGCAEKGAAPVPQQLLALVAVAMSVTATLAGTGALARLRTATAAYTSELSLLSARLLSVQEDERRRLSYALHDGVSQSLSAVLSALWLIEHDLPAEAALLRGHTADARHLAVQALADLREVAQRLRPAMLDDYGLVPSLESHLRRFATEHGLATELHVDGVTGRLPPALETETFRIAHDALASLPRDQSTRHVAVHLAVRPDRVRLEIADAGPGVAAGWARSPDPFAGVRARVRAVGGSVALASCGTRLIVELPRETFADVAPLPGAIHTTRAVLDDRGSGAPAAPSDRGA